MRKRRVGVGDLVDRRGWGQTEVKLDSRPKSQLTSWLAVEPFLEVIQTGPGDIVLVHLRPEIDPEWRFWFQSASESWVDCCC